MKSKGRSQFMLSRLVMMIALHMVIASCASRDLRPDRVSDQKPIVLMISIDGFRYDYLEKFKPPNLNRIAQEGLRTESMRPSFPTLTSPNQFTLVSGLRPSHHGIVGNTFFDRKRNATFSIKDKRTVDDGSWYLGEPIWTIAERNGIGSAVFNWLGSEAKIYGITPRYFVSYNSKTVDRERVKQVLEWLKLGEPNRPRFLALYFSSIDSVSHAFGTESRQLRDAIQEVDLAIGELDREISARQLPVNILLMSDHGMRNIERDKIIDVESILELNEFQVGDQGAVMTLYSDDQRKIDKAYRSLKKSQKNFKTYLRSEMPEEFHYSNRDRIGDIVIVADLPYLLLPRKIAKALRSEGLDVGAHGWSPSNKDMHAFFIAKGPQIQPGSVAPTFDNVDVFPVVLKLLGLKSPHPIDGKESSLAPYLRTAN